MTERLYGKNNRGWEALNLDQSVFDPRSILDDLVILEMVSLKAPSFSLIRIVIVRSLCDRGKFIDLGIKLFCKGLNCTPIVSQH